MNLIYIKFIIQLTINNYLKLSINILFVFMLSLLMGGTVYAESLPHTEESDDAKQTFYEKNKKIILIVSLAVLVIIMGLFIYNYGSFDASNSDTSSGDSSRSNSPRPPITPLFNPESEPENVTVAASASEKAKSSMVLNNAMPPLNLVNLQDFFDAYKQICIENTHATKTEISQVTFNYLKDNFPTEYLSKTEAEMGNDSSVINKWVAKFTAEIVIAKDEALVDNECLIRLQAGIATYNAQHLLKRNEDIELFEKIFYMTIDRIKIQNRSHI